MNLVGQKVSHKSFGAGVIIEVYDKYLGIDFFGSIKKIQYPESFATHMIADDSEIQKAMISMNEEKIAIAEEEKKKAEREKQKAQAQLASTTKLNNHAIKNPSSIISKRDESRKMFFLVFQGSTFGKEYKGRYIWAPCFNKAGQRMHHWDRLLDVRAGDVILHSSDGFISAISVAKNRCYDCEQPAELRTEALWERKGRRVDCDYVLINNPILLSDYKSQIIEKSSAKYSPFNCNGTGNQGYLFELNTDLAKLFVEESIKANRSLAAVDFIKKFIEE